MLIVVAGLVSFAILLMSGLSHIRHRERLISVLGRQKIIPVGIISPLAWLLIVAEATIGGAGLVILVFVSRQPWRVVLGVTAAGIYLVFAFYLALLLRRRVGGPCGCASGVEPASPWAVLRAVILAGFALAMVADPTERLISARLLTTESLFTLLASAAFAVLVWYFPSALRLPAPNYSGRQA